MIAGLSNIAFWDVDFNAIDYEKHSVYVVEKVFNYGLLQDQRAIVNHYGAERVIKDALNGTYYDKKVLNFLCVIFNLQPAQFKCYWRNKIIGEIDLEKHLS